MDKMPKFERSEYADSIYYADLFRIEDTVWMIMGYGKSDAARIASNKNRDCDLSRDCVAIRNEGGNLLGRYDPGGINPDVDSDLFKFHKINVVAYCLSPDQTEEVFKKQERVIRKVEQAIFGRLAVIYPYPAYIAHQLFTRSELIWLNNEQRRVERFTEITSSVRDTDFIVVPYMDAVEFKAKLYTDYSRGYKSK